MKLSTSLQDSFEPELIKEIEEKSKSS